MLKLLGTSFTWFDFIKLPMVYVDYVLTAHLEQLEQADREYKETGVPNIYLQNMGANGNMQAITEAFGGKAKENKPMNQVEMIEYLRKQNAEGKPLVKANLDEDSPVSFLIKKQAQKK